MLFKRWLSAGWLLLAICLGSAPVVARADSDLDHALATAPQGIVLDKTNAFVTTETTKKSSATVMDGKNEATPGTDVAALTSGTHQFGSLWSLDAGSFSLYRDQTISAWLYLGDQGVKSAGGVAFVLQNDWRGIGAMPVKSKDAIPAETVGVWGIDNDRHQSQPKALAETAIQNSWALEFDTGYNGDWGKSAVGQANAFDGAEHGPHIGNNFPADPRTYTQRVFDKGLLNHKHYYFNMTHHGVIEDVNHPNFLANGQWHHVTLKWDYRAETLSYAFDDRNPVTGERQPGRHDEARVFPFMLDPHQTGEVRWGFTATSGSQAENNLVVLENIPGLVSANANLTATNLSQARELTTNGQVLGGDRLQLDYQLKYVDGRQPWQNILANLALPTAFTPEAITITYQDAHLPPQTVPVRDVKDHRLSVRLREALNTANRQATVRVVGQVDTVTACTPVAPVTSTFTSTTQTCAVDSPKYFINPHADLDLKVTSDNPAKLAAGTATTVTGTVSPALTGLRVKPVLNGQALPDVPVKDGQFTLPVTAKQLQGGTNNLVLRAVTAMGDESAPVTVTLAVAGELKFSTVSPQENFQATRLTGQSQLVKRAGQWQLAVRDTRGTGERWTLTAAATPFIAKDAHGAQLVGQPVYVTDYQRIPILTTPTAVYSHVTDDSVADGEVDVAGGWRDDTGVLLHVQSASLSGQYQGTITWALTDAPQ